MLALLSVFPSFLLFLAAFLRPCFVLPIPESVAHFNSAGRHISLDKLSGPHQQQLKVLLLFFNHSLVWPLVYLFCHTFLPLSSFVSWFCFSVLLTDLSYLARYCNMIFSSSAALSIKLRLLGFYHCLS